MEPLYDRIISTPIDVFCSISGLGRTKVYELLNSGALESVKVGKRRLILVDSYRRLIANQRAARTASDAAALPSMAPSGAPQT